MNKNICLTFFYFITIFHVNQNLLSNEKYRALDRVVAIVEKEVITEIELQEAIKTTLNYSKKENISEDQYQSLVRSEVLDNLIQKSLIEQYGAQSGYTIDQKKIDAYLKKVSEKNSTTVEGLKKIIEKDGLKFNRFIDNIRYELILKQIKK